MLFGICTAKGVPLLELESAYSVGDLLTHHLDELEQEANRKGGVLQTLGGHFSIGEGVSFPHRRRF
jgi:hypothetical protein